MTSSPPSHSHLIRFLGSLLANCELSSFGCKKGHDETGERKKENEMKKMNENKQKLEREEAIRLEAERNKRSLDLEEEKIC